MVTLIRFLCLCVVSIPLFATPSPSPHITSKQTKAQPPQQSEKKEALVHIRPDKKYLHSTRTHHLLKRIQTLEAAVEELQRKLFVAEHKITYLEKEEQPLHVYYIAHIRTRYYGKDSDPDIAKQKAIAACQANEWSTYCKASKLQKLTTQYKRSSPM